MLTLQEIRQLTDRDLYEELEKASRDLLKFKMDLEGGYAKEIHKVRNLKRYIANLKTIQKENELNPIESKEPKKKAA
jgi:ribosomal protein L29